MIKNIQPAKKLRGTVTLPGDKSISHRALLLSALSDGPCEITGLSDGDDVISMLHCLQQMGIEIHQQAHGKTIVHGVGLRGFKAPSGELDCGNSGTTLRMLAGVLAAQTFESTLTGDGSLSSRPMQRIIIPLTAMGAEIDARPGGLAPLKIKGRKLQSLYYKLPIASAQVKSAILLAGLFAEDPTTVIEPAVTRDHTERMLTHMGCRVATGNGYIMLEPSPLRAAALHVPADMSAAAFFIAAALMVPGSEIEIPAVGMNPSRTCLPDLLRQAGGKIGLHNSRELNGEPIADLTVQHSQLQAMDIRGVQVPLLIDELPVLAVLATQCQGLTRIRDAAELRVKECDRIAAVAQNLRAMGADFKEYEDGFDIPGPQNLRAAEIEVFDDHRIAMAFTIAALVAKGETRILDAETATISFPGFYEVLTELAA